MQTQNEPQVPTKEQVIKFYKEQIEVAKLRRDLAEIAAQTAKFDADRAESIAKQAHFSAPRPQAQGEMPEGVIPHTVTQEDLDNNPELVAQGVKVGEVIGINSQATPEEAAFEKAVTEDNVRKLKKE